MKKALSLLLLLCVLLTALTACTPSVNTDDSITSGTTDQSQPSSNNSGVDELGFTIFPDGNYLADPKFNTDEFLPDYDSLPSLTSFFGNSNGRLFCTTEDTWYYNFKEVSDSLMYYDKATGISGPLCGKPECTHSDKSCNAYINDFDWGLSVYDGRLCWYSEDSDGTRSATLYSENLDGTDRTAVSLPYGDYRLYDYMGSNIYAALHRGYLYICGCDYIVESGVSCSVATVFAQPMDGSGERFMVFQKKFPDDKEGAVPLEFRMKLVGNDLYLFLYSTNSSNEESEHWETLDVYRWDTKSRIGELVFHNEYRDGVGFCLDDFYVIPGDGVYFVKQSFEFYHNEKGSAVRNPYDIRACKYSFETEAFVDIELEDPKIADISNLNGFYFSDNYIISYGYYHVYLWNYDGSLAWISDEIPGAQSLTGADDDNIYLLLYDMKSNYAHVVVPLDGSDMILLGTAEY